MWRFHCLLTQLHSSMEGPLDSHSLWGPRHPTMEVPLSFIFVFVSVAVIPWYDLGSQSLWSPQHSTMEGPLSFPSLWPLSVPFNGITFRLPLSLVPSTSYNDRTLRLPVFVELSTAYHGRIHRLPVLLGPSILYYGRFLRLPVSLGSLTLYYGKKNLGSQCLWTS